MRCHNCGSGKTESDSANGTSYCVDCGTVLEENTIVAEVTFGETAGGKAVLQGSYAGESGRISGGGLFGRNRGREGQEQAIENGRIRISSLAHAVRLPERYRDAAQRYYNLAVVNRFTRGRRSDQVAAVCLYAVCRTEKSSHMLIDFSDILQVNVFTLGATFLKLCRVLNLNLPHVDPSLYISRFAVALDFGDYTQRVAQDAVRIAQRMDRDWITSGRRPAGICGACLLIAARMNGFRRTTREMIYVVKVADVTIQKRLYEFNQTESAQLSVRDFRTIWLEKRADPPSFQKNRKKAEGAESEVEMDGFSSDSENEMGTRKRKGKGRANGSRPEKRRAVTLNEDEDEDELNRVSDEEVNGPFGNKQKNISKADNGANVNNTNSKTSMEEDTEEIEQELIQKQIEDSLNQEVRLIADTDASLSAQASIVKPKGKEKAILDEDATLVDIQTMSDNENEQTFVDDSEAEYIPVKSAAYEALTTEQKMELTAIAKAKVAQEENELLNKDLKDDALEIAKEMEGWMEDDSIMKAAKEIEKQNHDEDEENELENDDGNLSDVDDEEIEAMILTEEEVALKTRIWYHSNKEYLEEMAVRRMVEKDKGINPQSRKGKKHKKKMAPATTPAEAAKQLLEKKKMSKKINQAVFDDMFESPESIAKIKARDAIQRITGSPITNANTVDYEVVEESGDITTASSTKKTDVTGTAAASDQPAAAAAEEEEEEDDEEMDSDDMADDERFLRDARANYNLNEDDDVPDYGDDYDDDY